MPGLGAVRDGRVPSPASHPHTAPGSYCQSQNTFHYRIKIVWAPSKTRGWPQASLLGQRGSPLGWSFGGVQVQDGPRRRVPERLLPLGWTGPTWEPLVQSPCLQPCTRPSSPAGPSPQSTRPEGSLLAHGHPPQSCLLRREKLRIRDLSPRSPALHLRPGRLKGCMRGTADSTGPGSLL